MPRPFLLRDCRYALLTYSQIPEGQVESFPDHFATLAFTIPAEYTLAKESHVDGGIHFHAFLDFGRKRSFRGTGRFDCDGRHPNIERVGSNPRRAFDYVTKDGEIVAGWCEAPAERDVSGRGQGESASSDWSRIVSAEGRDEFFALCRELRPREFVCNFPAITKFADWNYRRIPEQYRHPENFVFNLDGYEVLLDWVDESLRGGLDRYVLALRGRRLRGAGPPRPRI